MRRVAGRVVRSRRRFGGGCGRSNQTNHESSNPCLPLITDDIDLGFAYEMPLTNKGDGIMEDRFTLDAVWRF